MTASDAQSPNPGDVRDIATIEWIVAQTMNVLEQDFGVEEIENFGRPTIESIAASVAATLDARKG